MDVVNQSFFFFFQAEDGIRDYKVTGVQTCALPICEVAGVNVAPLTIAALKGLLTPILEETINYVNAPVVARERGIEVKEVKSSDAGDFTSLVTLQVEAEKKTSRIAGALYGRRDPRIVQMDSFRVEIVPEGHMLFILNHDRPGVI